MAPLNALDRHLALVGFMGAGKSTLGPVVAERLGREFVSLDAVVEERVGTAIDAIFAESGEAAFRALEEEAAADVLARAEPAVVELGGGAVTFEPTRRLLAGRAFAVLIDVAVDEAWRRVEGSGRPLATDPERFRALHAERDAYYGDVADGRARDADGVVLAAAGVHVQRGSIDLLDSLVPGTGQVELVSDRHVAGIYGVQAQIALGERLLGAHEVPQGEAAKAGAVLERLWRELRGDRSVTVVALGGGTATDVAGLAAATYLRGVPWVPVPTTLIGQVDAAIGGKTAIDVPSGKNLVGAFHWPARVVVDPGLLETLADRDVQNGLAEVVKTGLLCGEPLWELPVQEQVRRCAAFKAAVCLRDPFDRGPRNQLNLGHTFAHALEAAAGFTLPHGEAVALGLLAALRLSGQETAVVEEVLSPQPVRVDPDAAWRALARDKKSEQGSPRLVLLEAPGRPRIGVQVPAEDVRAALAALIVDA
ncbi:MAG: bifunctional shikimate kinase/3-dehydroquinate synthase [Actinobacteria bacterium]|nr:MAG: bifunctional shikimate kinase/3-dehydroquinate synthase [Actinomycetota bacterium]